MFYDRQGNPMTGAIGNAGDLFGQALTAFNIYRGDPVALLDEAIAEAPAFAMAHILKAYTVWAGDGAGRYRCSVQDCLRREILADERP